MDRDYVRRLADEALAAGDQTAWFERLYREAEAGTVVVPWSDGEPNPHLVAWAARGVEGEGRRALVVGCGSGEDAEYVASLGFDTVAFDIAPSAVSAARRAYPNSTVEYVTADVLEPPLEWRGGYDLVVEIYTLQVLRDAIRSAAIASLAELVASGGTLLVIARAAEEGVDPGPFPWPITHADIDAFGGHGLVPVRVEHFHDAEHPPKLRWRAEFLRPAGFTRPA